MIKNFEQLKEMLKAMPVKRKVAVVPAQDEHTLEAISHAYRDGMVEPVCVTAQPVCLCKDGNTDAGAEDKESHHHQHFHQKWS